MSAFSNALPRKRRKFKLKKPNAVKSLSLPLVLVTAILIVLPMILLLVYSFIEKNDIAYKINFSNYLNAFTTSYYLTAIGSSLKYAFIATFICLILGYPFAFFLTKVREKYRGIILLLVNAPMWINMTLRVFGLKGLLSDSGYLTTLLAKMGIELSFINNGSALIIGLVYIYLPFMIIPIYTSLIKIEHAYLEAGDDLGATPFQVFTKIIFPLSFSGVLSGITMVFLPTATAIVAPQYLYNWSSNGQVIGQIIEYKINHGSYGEGSAISIVLAILITLMSISVNHFDRYAKLNEEDN